MFSASTRIKIERLADSIGVEAAALLAVAEVESAGVTFWNVAGKQLPPIRFEGHYFYKRLKGTKLAIAIEQGLASPKAGAVKNPTSYTERYALLARAVKIDMTAAYESTSWGLGQVMGGHWQALRFKSVEELVSMAKSGIEGQIEVMARYIRAFNLIDELQTKGWQSFADQYNGPASRKNRYAEKLNAAYVRYSTVASADAPDVPAWVATAQRDLGILGFYSGPMDGKFGPMTKSALIRFQQSEGLVADGKYGKMTDEALDREIAARHRTNGDTYVKSGTSVTGGAALADVIREQTDQLSVVAYYSDVVQYLVIALVVAGVIITLYGLWHKYKGHEQ